MARKKSFDEEKFCENLEQINMKLSELLLDQLDGKEGSEVANPVVSNAINFLKFHGRRVEEPAGTPGDPNDVFSVVDEDLSDD